MNGYSLSMIADKTGININKLKSIVARDKVVREMPYSVKSGKNRVFFDDFVMWLKRYEGIEEVELHKLQTSNQRNSIAAPLPNGAQLAILYRAVKDKVISPVQFQHAIGVPVVETRAVAVVRPEGPLAGTEEIAAMERFMDRYSNKAVRSGAAAMRQTLKAGQARLTQELLNGHLDFAGKS